MVEIDQRELVDSSDLKLGKKMQIRRSALSCVAIFTVFSSMALTVESVSACPQSKAVNHDIAIKFEKDQQVRVSGEYEYEGSVIVVPDDLEKKTKLKPKSLPLRVSARLKYTQRSTGNNQAVRFYDGAAANIKLDQGRTNPNLLKSNRLIIARLKDKPMMRVEMASIRETLSQKEFELIQTSADPLSLPKLFAKRKASIGDKWKPDLDALAKFLNVDKIITTDVRMHLKSIEEGIARVYVSGGVMAQQFDVTTDVTLGGFALIDLKKNQVKSVKLSTEEICPPGQIVPGFKGRTRIDQDFRYGIPSKELSNTALATAMRSAKVQQRLKFESDKGSYRITYDPRWKLIAGESDSAIMRFIDRGDLLTQCTVVLLPRRAANQPLTLKKYKAEIGKVIEEDDKAKLVRADELTTDNGLTALSVVVAGEEEELPVNWIYYHVSDNQGRQITFVFTLAETAAGRVAGAAKQLVDEFKFLGAASKIARKNGDSAVYRAPK
jgi:hypothetical protein